LRDKNKFCPSTTKFAVFASYQWVMKMKKTAILLCVGLGLLAGCAANGAVLGAPNDALGDVSSATKVAVETAPTAGGTAVATATPVPATATPQVTATPEPAPVALEIAQAPVSLSGEGIPFCIVNRTEETVQVLLIPTLERQEGGAWQPLACNTLFCGTPDGIADAFESEVPFAWYDDLAPGRYRLSYSQVAEAGYESIETLSAEFDLAE
jgi:hypothetical protein